MIRLLTLLIKYSHSLEEACSTMGNHNCFVGFSQEKKNPIFIRNKILFKDEKLDDRIGVLVGVGVSVGWVAVEYVAPKFI